MTAASPFPGLPSEPRGLEEQRSLYHDWGRPASSPSAMARLMARLSEWDPSDGVPPAEMIAEYNEAMGSPPGWATIDGGLEAGSSYVFDYPDSCYLLAGGPYPAHEHAGNAVSPYCRHRAGPDRVACTMLPDHPIHRPDRPLEFCEWPDIIETYDWLNALYLLSGGR